jgi:epoxyqueuosine reductase
MDFQQLAARIRIWGGEFGFQQIGIAGTALTAAESRLDEWVSRGFHGELGYMTRHGRRRSRPADLIPGTARIISARMDYLPAAAAPAAAVLADGERAFIARYALGRDYHKLLRRRLAQLADRISTAGAPHGYRVFVDSAPVLEKPLAAAAGLGWQAPT